MEVAAPEGARGPCAGLRVLDFSTVVSGPLCAQILGDLGADVIKVETPGGDFSRHTPPLREGLSGFFAQFNRNKRSLAVDLKSERSRDVVRRLARAADVLIENFRPGVADRLGIGYAALREVNPGLVYVSINGFGPDGPYAVQPAYDLVIQALVGVMPVQGGDESPVLMKSLVADKCASLTAVGATLGALLHRERSGGQGQKVDVPMLDAFAAYILPDLIVGESFQPRQGPPSTGFDIYRVMRTADGFVTGIVIQDSQFEGFCRAIEREDLLEKPEYANILQRLMHAEELYRLMEAELRKWTTEEFIARARDLGVPFAPVQNVEAFFADPQVAHNRTYFEVVDPEAGTARYLRHPVRYEASPASLRRHPPRLGEHSDEILAEAGFAGEEIARLREEAVVS